MSSPNDPNTLFAAIQREVFNVKDQIDSVRRIVNQLIQKVTRHDELLTTLKSDQDKMAEKHEEEKDERVHEIHAIESSRATLKSHKDIVPGISISTLLSIIALSGSGIAGYVMLKSDVAVHQKTVTDLETTLSHLKEDADDNHSKLIVVAKEYTDNMLRINALQTANDGTTLKGAVNTLEMSVQLLKQTTAEHDRRFSSEVNDSIEDLKGMEKRVNAALSSIEGIQTQLSELTKKRH